MKCHFYSKCPISSPTSNPCILDGGEYYGPGRPGGCYREMEKQEKKMIP